MTANKIFDEHAYDFLVLSSSNKIPCNSRELKIGTGLIFADAGPQGQFCIAVDPDFLPAVFKSHWNQDDGVNGPQFVTESVGRTTTRISTPTSEGVPFETNGWAGTNQDTHITSTQTFTTNDAVTGFGSGSFFEVKIQNADSTSAHESAYFGPLTGSGVSVSGSITLTLTGFAANSTRFAATASVSVDISTVLSESGRYHIETIHTTDPDTDTTGPHSYVQTDLFFDDNPTTPTIDSDVVVGETSGSTFTKHLSGLEYYIIPSAFTIQVLGVNKLNEDTIRTSQNLRITGTEYGLPTLNHSPFGTGAGFFSGWTNAYDNISASYENTAWEIDNNDYRYVGPTANVSAFPRDSWNDGSTISTPDDEVLIDTFGTDSTNLFETFNDEDRRQTEDYNNGSTDGNWDSSKTLVNGEAQVFGGQLIVPSVSTFIRSDGSNDANADWTSYVPNLSGTNPDYTLLSGIAITGSTYFRSFPDTAGSDRASFTVVFSGDFTGSDALADLTNGSIQMFLRKVDGIGNVGSTHTSSLNLHGPVYNFATFDDGVTDGQCREATSSGNTINGTFGGFAMNDGVYMEVRIQSSSTKISSLSWTFI